jgi:uncharacterized protein (TIGR02145 family)
MDNGKWSGGFEIKAETPIFEGDEIMIIFFADMNNNGIIDAGDIPMDTVYYSTADVAAGELFPIAVGPVNTMAGKQLLAYLSGRHVCGDVLPLVTLFGIQELCQEDTMEYRTVPGMKHYNFSISGTAGGIRIPLNGEYDYSDKDSIARFVFRFAGIDTISVQYCLPSEIMIHGPLLGRTLLEVVVHPHSTENEIDIDDTTICFNTNTSLTASSANVTNATFRWYASQTASTWLHEGDTYTTPVLTASTNYYVSVFGDNYCENYPDERAKVTVSILRVLPTISISTPTPTVCLGTSVSFYATATNGGPAPTYQWRVNGNSSGTNNAQFIYTPTHNDVVTCALISNATCANPATVSSIGVTMEVLNYPTPPPVITETLDAYYGIPVDLMGAVIDVIPGMIYNFYNNPNKIDKLPSSIVVFEYPKDDYYVAIYNGYCEGPSSPIILKVPCEPTTSDREGNIYNVTGVGGLCWTDNIRSKIYSSTGDSIPFAVPYTCKVCPPSLDTVFGLLYDWYSAIGDSTGYIGIQGVCPNGYHIPSIEEWRRLEKYHAQQLMSTEYWLDPPGPGTDNFGFCSLPSGWYSGSNKKFQELYGFAGWWSAEDSGSITTATCFCNMYYCSIILETVKYKIDALSVRCVKDQE